MSNFKGRGGYEDRLRTGVVTKNVSNFKGMFWCVACRQSLSQMWIVFELMEHIQKRGPPRKVHLPGQQLDWLSHFVGSHF